MISIDELIHEIEIVCPQTDNKPEPDSLLKEDLMISSIKMMHLIMKIERLCGIELDVEKLIGICTVNDLYNRILLSETADEKAD